jgi:hypothetical protein
VHREGHQCEGDRGSDWDQGITCMGLYNDRVVYMAGNGKWREVGCIATAMVATLGRCPQDHSHRYRL